VGKGKRVAKSGGGEDRKVRLSGGGVGGAQPGKPSIRRGSRGGEEGRIHKKGGKKKRTLRFDLCPTERGEKKFQKLREKSRNISAKTRRTWGDTKRKKKVWAKNKGRKRILTKECILQTVGEVVGGGREREILAAGKDEREEVVESDGKQGTERAPEQGVIVGGEKGMGRFSRLESRRGGNVGSEKTRKQGGKDGKK